MRDLIEAARAVQGEFYLDGCFRAGAVGAAIRTAGGSLYTGISIEMACGIGFCAEHAAVAEMLKARETHIVSMVAVSDKEVLPPCGRCRELLLQVNPENAEATVGIDVHRTRPLGELLPHRWY